MTDCSGVMLITSAGWEGERPREPTFIGSPPGMSGLARTLALPDTQSSSSPLTGRAAVREWLGQPGSALRSAGATPVARPAATLSSDHSPLPASPAAPARAYAWKSAGSGQPFRPSSAARPTQATPPNSTASRKITWSECLVSHTADQPLRSRAGDDDPTSTSRRLDSTRLRIESLSASRTPNPSSPYATLPRPIRQTRPWKQLLELFAEVGHQISSPSFLICS